METLLRIRESSPSELLCRSPGARGPNCCSHNPEQAKDYRNQAEMLRAMIAIQKVTTRNMFADNFLTNH